MVSRAVRRQFSRTLSFRPSVTSSANIGKAAEAELKPVTPEPFTIPKAVQAPVYHLPIVPDGKRTMDEVLTPSVLAKLRTTRPAAAGPLLVHLPVAEALHNAQASRTAEQITEVPPLSVLSKLRTQGQEGSTTPKKNGDDAGAGAASKTDGAADITESGNNGGSDDGEQLRPGPGSPPQMPQSLPLFLGGGPFY
ncbi:hypothetical protein MFIFM68171_00951 [Madurella fahalii]|uniref:Uncharacterized protein n=1 Tax=Madurella fahalii TaxID=1157608 RepID=A0ABQ0FZ10_9PEZI